MDIISGIISFILGNLLILLILYLNSSYESNKTSRKHYLVENKKLKDKIYINTPNYEKAKLYYNIAVNDKYLSHLFTNTFSDVKGLWYIMDVSDTHKRIIETAEDFIFINKGLIPEEELEGLVMTIYCNYLTSLIKSKQ